MKIVQISKRTIDGNKAAKLYRKLTIHRDELSEKSVSLRYVKRLTMNEV